MESRFVLRTDVPELYRHLLHLDAAIHAAGLDPLLLELIKIRASQINKCAYCIDRHTADAIRNGETPRRIFALSAWQESPLFTEKEKAVLQLTEEVTLIHEKGLTESTYLALGRFFDRTAIAQMVTAVIMINAWNRSAVSSLLPIAV